MTGYNFGDIILVPFPFMDQDSYYLPITSDGSPLPWCCRYGLCREDMAEEQDASISRRGSEAINLVPW
jgi:hypothetical protein